MPASAGGIARSGPSYALLQSVRLATGRRFRPTCHRLRGRGPASERLVPVHLVDEGCNAIQKRFASSAKPTEDSNGRVPTTSEEGAPHPNRLSEVLGTDTSASVDGKARQTDKKYYGSYRRRASRGSAEAKLIIPEWFLTKNVTLSEDINHRSSQLNVIDDHISSVKQDHAHSASHEVQDSANKSTDESMTENNSALYQIDKVIYDEINFMMLGGLRASSTSASEDALNSRSHLLLQSPQSGGELFLDAVVAQAAQSRQLDLLTLDPQDIADIASEFPEAFPERSLAAIRRLGFDTYVFEDEQYAEPSEESSPEQDSADDSLDVNPDDRGKAGSLNFPGINASSIKPLQHMIQVWFPNKSGLAGVSPSMKNHPHSSLPNFFTASNKVENLYAPNEYDPTAVIRKFLDAPQLKREILRSGPSVSREFSENDQQPQGLILHIKDYLELCTTTVGGAVLDQLHAAIDLKRREGRPILIVGTSSSSDLVPSLTKSGFTAMQAGSDGDKFRTIVTTCRNSDAESVFVEDTKVRTARINCRNILATLRELYPDPLQLDTSLLVPNFGLTSEQMFQFDLAEEVWPLERVQRMASIASGILQPGERMSGRILSLGLEVMEVSDKAKYHWINQELKRNEDQTSQVSGDRSKQEEKRRTLLKNCNRYERKLMNGVIDAQKLKTTFDDVHVPLTTVEALKTLTTLSLVRPEAFTYGVLATDRIPGLLLYGPPGTGKTLLAKAVAKESGATVLEVSGSDIYDMYVGEGEKNVRAIFTLARKLSPCVVFIDEADAIFGSRSSSHNRKSHRELINQFLREWDGMNDFSAFIMVATNRPFDLDDAVLRRLPRRLLVDLPTKKDRQAILEIHLKAENLDSDVNLSDLAAQTPYYSGSDLKNLCVAAALACVREENDLAAKHTGNEVYKFPEKRTLRYSHFDKAMAEISASVSEDMSSLSAIRKFDEKYGDRKGRRKRQDGLGFGTSTGKDKEREQLEEGRVRKSDVAIA